MAARFVVGLAVIALCHSSPVLLNEIRDGRSLSIAKGSASGYGGENRATANVHGNVAHATGTTNGAGLARDGLYYPGQGQAIANAQSYDQVDQAAIDIARAQGYYQPLHIAQPAVITYNQNLVPAEQLVYQPLAVAPSAESVATTNGNSESSLSTATNNGGGTAESNARTQGNYGLTTTNAKTVGAYNTAASNANTGLDHASVSSKASGSTAGSGYASSNAQTNGLYNVAPIAPVPTQVFVEPTIIAAKNQGFYNPALYGSASSNANVHGQGSAVSSARTGPARRSIHWRFGTAYDIPAGYGSIKAVAPVVYQPAPVLYQAIPAEVSPYGTAQTSSNTHGAGAAQATANLNPGVSNTRSTASSQLGGSANSNAGINNNAYGLYRSGAVNTGITQTRATSNGPSNADSNASLNHGVGIAKSTANSNGGSANANADINNRNFGLYRTAGEGAWGNIASNAATTLNGNAQSNAQAYPSGLKTADSFANSNGWGSAIANSQSL